MMDTILAKILINTLEDATRIMVIAVEREDSALALTAVASAEDGLAVLRRIFEDRTQTPHAPLAS